MKKWQKDFYVKEEECNYCLKQWNEFLELTEEERDNLDEMLGISTKRVYDNVTGQIFNTIRDVCDFYELPRSTVQNHIYHLVENPRWVRLKEFYDENKG